VIHKRGHLRATRRRAHLASAYTMREVFATKTRPDDCVIIDGVTGSGKPLP
jgi:hypothetical protein